MRIRWFVFMALFAMTAMLTGCNGGDAATKKGSDASNQSGGTVSADADATKTSQLSNLPAYEKVVMDFISNVMANENEKAFALLTPTAQAAYQKEGMIFQFESLAGLKCRLDGSNPIEGRPGERGVYVTMFENTPDGDIAVAKSFWSVRSIGTEFRLVGLMITMLDETGNVIEGQELLCDFEDPKGSYERAQPVVQSETVTPGQVLPGQQQQIPNQVAGMTQSQPTTIATAPQYQSGTPVVPYANQQSPMQQQSIAQPQLSFGQQQPAIQPMPAGPF